ncbi:MAG TPA: glycosyltransferase family 1 protein [Bryobacteraceae bacterium]|nr:glycosyltransferase family 1 protein [Bryobacteraceae bacterium]
MKIALDATPLTVPSGGAKRYTEELSLALAANFPEDEFWLLSDQSFDALAAAPPNLKTGRGPRNLLERRWWLWGLQGEVSRLRIDLFHGTDFAVPYLPLRPTVMTFHDLSPWMDPSWHADADRVRNRTPMLLRLGLATMMITPSEAVRRQAIERFHLQAGRVAAIPHAASKHFRPVMASREGPPYLLYVGTLEPRKNIHLLLEVWREVRKQLPVDLVLAGRRRADFPEIPPERGLHLAGLTQEDELPQLYSNAVACLYPSYYEGFGLPVLEAMQCGAAVIASSDPAISEVAGDAAVLLDARDQRAWIQALESLLANPEQLRVLRDKAIARAAEFSWTKTAKLTREVYGHAAERFRKKV